MGVELTVTVQEQPEGVDVPAILADVGMGVKNQIGLNLFHCDWEGGDGVATDQIKARIEKVAEGLKITVMEGSISW